MIVADTSPLNYLIQLDAIDLLPALYQNILVPRSVLAELAHSHSLAAVRLWTNQLPAHFEVVLATNFRTSSALERIYMAEIADLR